MGRHHTIESRDGAFDVRCSTGRDGRVGESHKRGGGTLSTVRCDSEHEKGPGGEIESVSAS